LDQRYFSLNGLNLTPSKYDTGFAALGGLLNHEVDIVVGTTEFPVVGKALQRENFLIIGNIDKVELIYLLGRKDRGIEKVSDLQGKRIGTTFGTVAHFHLGRFLNLHGIAIHDTTLVDLKKPEEWVNAVVDGRIDAVATAQPYALFAKHRLGEKGIAWPVQSGQPAHGVVITSNQWLTKHPDGTRRFLQSLAQAEEYLLLHPAEAKAILQKQLNLDTAYVETIWPQNQFSLSLDQALVATMEDEARWLIRNNLTSEENVPNFLDYIYEEPLKAIRAHAVSIIR
jgi:NitT/TauT family transport system substrate-binding protein